jgi:hypothetical protein
MAKVIMHSKCTVRRERVKVGIVKKIEVENILGLYIGPF